MPSEDAGNLTVKYTVISDAAIRRLERLQKHFDKVGDAAEKQGKKVEASYKKQAKAIAAYGTVATGVLYGLIRASSYASMWMDQLGHSMTRIANIVLEKLGLKDAIDFLVVSFGLLADELEKPEETDFWSNLVDDFIALDAKAKIATLALLAVGGAITVIGLAISLASFKALLAKLGLLAISSKLLIWVWAGFKSALAIVTGAISLTTLAIGALVLAFVYLWSKTEHGKAQIESLINVWNNFRDDIGDVGWLRALGNAIEDIGKVLWFELFYWIKLIPTGIKTFFSNSVYGVMYTVGAKVVDKLVDGLDSMFPGFKEKWSEFKNWTITSLTNLATSAYNKGIEIINRLIDGIDAKLPGFKTVVNYFGNLWKMEGDAMVVSADRASTAAVDKWINTMDTQAAKAAAEAKAFGAGINTGVANGVSNTSDSICDEMVNAVDCVGNGVGGINAALDAIETDIVICVSMAYKQALAGDVVGGTADPVPDSYGGSGDSSTGEGWGGYSASSWKLSGWMNSATGGHVGRTGTAMVHQGEDIVNLQRLLNGKSDNKSRSGDIIVNSTVNIESNGKMSDPFEANRIADVISKRMGDELRRITTNI